MNRGNKSPCQIVAAEGHYLHFLDEQTDGKMSGIDWAQDYLVPG